MQVPVEVAQFLGRWLALDEEQRSRLPAVDCPDGQFNQLGRDLVIGAQVWDVQSSLRLRLGPMSRRVFGQLLPGGIGMRQLIALARIYAGPELDFEVAPDSGHSSHEAGITKELVAATRRIAETGSPARRQSS